MKTLAHDIQTDTDLTVLRTLGEQLVSQLAAEQEIEGRIKTAIRESVERGHSIDDISEASGYPPSTVREISERPQRVNWDHLELAVA